MSFLGLESKACHVTHLIILLPIVVIAFLRDEATPLGLGDRGSHVKRTIEATHMRLVQSHPDARVRAPAVSSTVDVQRAGTRAPCATEHCARVVCGRVFPKPQCNRLPTRVPAHRG